MRAAVLRFDQETLVTVPPGTGVLVVPMTITSPLPEVLLMTLCVRS
jgi:hypothetical protein